MRLTWPLTGRSEEMGLLKDAISAPDISGIAVHGPAGVGKSRVAREALSFAESMGCEVRWAVGASSARELPLGALAEWAGVAVAQPVQVVGAVIESLTSASPGATVVVGVDDVHLLDDLSAFVIHQIVQRVAAKVVLTVRLGEPIPPGVRDIWKAGQFERLDLQPLSKDETTTLLSAVLGGTLDPAAVGRLWTLTRGNVLYLRNIVEREVEDGRLAPRAGYWRWTGDPIVPPGLVEMIQSRTGDLSSEVGEVIDALAVCEPIELASLTRITHPAAVEEAEARGLITLKDGENDVEVRVAHPLYAEVRRKQAAASRLRRLRGLVANELAASDSADDWRIVVRRATLSLDSDLQPDRDLLVRAALGALWLADLPLADRLADAAIGAGGGAEAMFFRALALSWLGPGKDADAVLANIPASELSDVDQGKLAFLRAVIMLGSLADPAGAKRFIDDALQAMRTGPARSCIDASLTMFWATMGKPDKARKFSAKLRLEQLPGFVSATTAFAIAVASGDAGRTTEAVRAADTGYALSATSVEAAYMRYYIADAHVGALLQAGHIGDATNLAERICDQAADLPGSAPLFSTGVAGRVALGAGRLHAASSMLGPVAEAFIASGDAIGWGYRYQVPHTIALAMRGSSGAADALAALEKQRHPSRLSFGHEDALAHAWVAACQGAVSEAISLALAAAETTRSNGQFAAEVVCLQTATQFGEHSGATRLRELAALVEGPRVGLAARFAEALQAGEGAELAEVSEEFEQMGDLVAALDAAAHAAAAHRRKGLRGSGLGCATRAKVLAEQCGGASTPALERAVERAPLTTREQEIVALIGEGLSNRALAERLHVSVRTIEGHIYRAMAKTGAADRDALAAMLPWRRPGSGE